MTLTHLTVDEIRARAIELERERKRANQMRETLEQISRWQIMDSLTAIKMRSAALAALAIESRP